MLNTCSDMFLHLVEDLGTLTYIDRNNFYFQVDHGTMRMLEKAKTKNTSSVDQKYQANKAQPTLDWLGTVQRKGTQQRAKDVKMETAEPTKKLYGLF